MRLGMQHFDIHEQFQSALAGQVNFQKHQIWDPFLNYVHGLGGVRRFATHTQARLAVDYDPQTFPGHGMIIHNDDILRDLPQR